MEHTKIPVINAIKYGFKNFFHHPFLWIVSIINALIINGSPALITKLRPTFTIDFNALQVKRLEGLLSPSDLITFLSNHILYLVSFFFLYWVVICILNAGTIQICFDIINTKSSHLGRLFSWASRAPHIIAFMTVYLLLIIGLLAAVGITTAFLSVIVPKSLSYLVILLAVSSFFFILLYTFGRLIFSLYAFIERKKGIYDAFSFSWYLTPGNLLRIYGLILCFILLTLPFHILIGALTYFYQFQSSLLNGIIYQPFAIISGLAMVFAYKKLAPLEENI